MQIDNLVNFTKEFIKNNYSEYLHDISINAYHAFSQAAWEIKISWTDNKGHRWVNNSLIGYELEYNKKIFDNWLDWLVQELDKHTEVERRDKEFKNDLTELLDGKS